MQIISKFHNNYTTANKRSVRFGCNENGPCQPIEDLARLLLVYKDINTDVSIKEIKKEVAKLENKYDLSHDDAAYAVNRIGHFALVADEPYEDVKKMICGPNLREDIKQARQLNASINLRMENTGESEQDATREVIKDLMVLLMGNSQKNAVKKTCEITEMIVNPSGSLDKLG